MTEQTQISQTEKIEHLVQVQIKNKIEEVVRYNVIMDGYRQKIKDIREEVKTLGLETKVFNKLVKMYEKDEREKVEEEGNAIIELYDEIFQED